MGTGTKATYKIAQHEPLPQSFCQWDPGAKDGEGGWVAVAPVPVVGSQRLPRLMRAFEKITRPKPQGRKALRALRSPTLELRETDGEPNLVSIKRARAERVGPSPVIRRALWA
jgi:hypothetical protein